MTHFPNESNEYRRARTALLDEEIELLFDTMPQGRGTDWYPSLTR